MKFRPCIDIHNGKVKQIVGGSLKDSGDFALENFTSDKRAAFYAGLYQKDRLSGGHLIILNPKSSPYYKQDLQQAYEALAAYPGGLMAGGGITDENAGDFIRAGASHVIVTSFVFQNGRIDMEHLKALSSRVGKEHLVLDLSCRKKEHAYYVVTDRWQKFTDVMISSETLDMLAPYCSEFLVHAADVEGKSAGIETGIVKILASWGKCPITYAGGIGSLGDIELLKNTGQGKIDFTVGSALDIFGGLIAYKDVIRYQ